MRVNGGIKSHEGVQRRAHAGCPWRGGGTTWGTSHPRHLMRSFNMGRTSQQGGVKADTVCNKFILVMGKSKLEGGGGVGPVHHALLQKSCSITGVQAGLETMGGMAGKNPFDMEGNHNGHPPRWLRDDQGAQSSGVEEAKVRVDGKGEEDLGERWFR